MKKFHPIKPEGFIGGAVFTIAAGILCSLILNHLTLTDWIVIASIVIIFGTLGDLLNPSSNAG